MVVRKHQTTGIPWYSHDAQELEQQIRWSFLHDFGPKALPTTPPPAPDSKALGVVSPHAGFSCSGPFAAHGFLELSKTGEVDDFIVLGTNHTGFGPPISVFPEGQWETPMGSVSTGGELTNHLFNLINNEEKLLNARFDEEAHQEEHSIDNQIPFLQYTFGSFDLLPICLRDHRLETCLALGKLLARLIEESARKIKIVASSDFSHYLTPQEARKRDMQVIEALLELDLRQASELKTRLQASICGFGPIITLLATGKELGHSSASLLKYGHSGETCGGMSQVVGYASILV